MKKLTKITFTVTSEEAATLARAINFFRVGCTKATAENHDGEKVSSSENMAALEVTPRTTCRRTGRIRIKYRGYRNQYPEPSNQ